MVISHKSVVHKPVEYVAPVDLGLLSNVLQAKQGEYDAGVKQVQGLIDSAASLDVVKDSDRQYLTSKINNLVQTVNSIGGAEFSDPNVTNQIAGLSSQIYGDDKVINAVASTKKFRYVQSYYKDLKEKKPKDYNPANEWYDMDKFSSWLMDGQVGSSAQSGAGQVTPFTKYDEDWQKLFDKIVSSANVTTEITDKGLMYRLDTHKVVSPERIWETASKLLTPAQRQQLAIEGRFTYNGLPVSELTKAYDSETYKKVEDAKNMIDEYKTKLKGASAIADQEKYTKLIAEKEAEVNSLLSPIRKNQEQIKENLYINEKLKGLQARYSFQQSTSKLQAASDKMFKLKYEMDKAKFQYQQQNDALNREADLAKEGLMTYVDPLTGQHTIIQNPNIPAGAGSRGKNNNPDQTSMSGLDNSLEEQKIEFGKENLDKRKSTLVSSNSELFRKFVTDFGRKKGLTDVIITDLQDGNLTAKVDPEMQKAAQEMMNSWNAMTRGEKINYETLDPMFKNFAGKYQENLKEIEAIDRYYDNIDKQILSKYGVTKEAVEAYLQDKKDVALLQKSGKTFTPTPEGIKRAFASTPYNKKAVEEYLSNKIKDRDKLIETSSVRFNLPFVTISDTKNNDISKIVAFNAGTLQHYDSNGKANAKEVLDPSKIELIGKGYSLLEGVKQPTITFKYQLNDNKNYFEIRKVPLTTEQARTLGFGTEVQDFSGYNLGLHLNGEVNGVNTTSGKNYDLKYDIVKYNVENQNDPTVFLRVKKGGNVISLYNKPFPSYELAMKFMEGATKQKDADEAYKFLEELSK